MSKKKFSFKRRIRSFGFAFRGIGKLIKEEHNAWIHCFAALCVIVAGFCFGLSVMEWVAIVFAIGSVLAAEAFNTAIEALCDFASPAYQEAIKHTKDLAAGAVLIIAIAAAVVGLLIFIPKIMALC
jgi:diacylglycerol kinase (ATP)